MEVPNQFMLRSPLLYDDVFPKSILVEVHFGENIGNDIFVASFPLLSNKLGCIQLDTLAFGFDPSRKTCFGSSS